MGSLFGLFPFLLKLYADSGYQGAKFQEGLHRICNLEIVKRCEIGKFVGLPKRWIAERTIACLGELSSPIVPLAECRSDISTYTLSILQNRHNTTEIVIERNFAAGA
jgi:hypothetical protein